jgi:hypothetical protein
MAKTAMNYELNFIDCISTLSPIMPQLIFKNTTEEDGTKKVVVKANDVTRSLLYVLEAPQSYFNFTGNNFALLDYNKFAAYFNTFRPKDAAKAPLLSVEPDTDGEPHNVFINSQISPAEIKQTLANIDVISKPIFDKISDGDADGDLTFDEAQFAELKKMVGMIGADTANIHADDDIVTITLSSKLSDDRFVQQYKANNNVAESFNLNIPAKNLTLIPDGAYHITVDKEGLVVFHQERKDAIKLSLYICEA